MTDYRKLSDFEINRAVAMKIEGVSANEDGSPKFAVDCFLSGDGESVGVLWTGYDEASNFDPCNNPADAWPIIVENKINIEWHEWKGGEFKPYALNNETMKSGYDDKPLRAAMIVFLMMKEAGNV